MWSPCLTNDKHTIHEILPRPARPTFAFLGGARLEKKLAIGGVVQEKVEYKYRGASQLHIAASCRFGPNGLYFFQVLTLFKLHAKAVLYLGLVWLAGVWVEPDSVRSSGTLCPWHRGRCGAVSSRGQCRSVQPIGANRWVEAVKRTHLTCKGVLGALRGTLHHLFSLGVAG